MGYLDQELSAAEIGDLSVLEAAATAPLSNVARRPGESLASWGKRLKAGDAAAANAKTRSGKSSSAFEQSHPRGRGGEWVLKNGSNGQEVRAVQSRVGVKTDGRYGRLTTAAVKRFQRRHGLKVDGIVGAQTVAALMGNRRAAQVKAGVLSAADRRWLASH